MHNNIFFLEKKSPPYQRGREFRDGHCIIFVVFFYLVMFHESQNMSLYGCQKIVNFMLYVN
jgi:hypothetical protein